MFIPFLPLTLALPLAGFLALAVLGRRLPGRVAGWLATGLVGVAFLLALGIALEFKGLPANESVPAEPQGAHSDGPVVRQQLWRWMEVGQSQVLLTLATQELEPGKEITADAVGAYWVAEDASSPDTSALGNVWDAKAVVGERSMIQTTLPAGSVITRDRVPPSSDKVFTPIQTRRQHAFSVDVALQLDGLSLLMLLIVTGVGFLIHVFSLGYMSADPDLHRYFAYLNLFIFSMLTLVLGANFLVLFVGWELVGACSYLLIGFWYRDTANADAGRKAFIVNRVGDFAFLLGLMLIWSVFGSLTYAEVLPRAAELLPMGAPLAVGICLLLVVGAAGKSAQIPLYVWLPDAMAGPTPVSALIHAATMVTAGVYLIARAHALFEQAPAVMALLAVIGAATALLAALIATVQVDIKRVLAYSTISQLGYMFLGVGAGAYIPAVFHLMTHAFFKALLFLGAGSVMHAVEHGFHVSDTHPEALDGVPAHQDMRRMGGLLGKIPTTGWTFLIGGLALAGVFPLAGFWSKDEILHGVIAHEGGGLLWTVLYGVALFTAFLTAFYTGRQLLMVLAGAPRSEGAERAHESPPSMTVPLIVLAVLTLVGGLPGIALGGRAAMLTGLLGPVLGEHGAEGGPSVLLLALVATTVALAGLLLAWLTYGPRRAVDPAAVTARAPWAYRLAWHKFYVDELYMTLFVDPFRRAADFLWRVVDDGLVDGAVNGVGRLMSGLGDRSRRLQTGHVRSYVLSMLVGALFVALYLFLKVF